MSINFSGVKKFLTKKKTTNEGPSEIGAPTNVKRVYHVVKNKESGDLEGLPAPWIKELDAQIS